MNIQTPSAAGVSRNVYSQFDVPKTGTVLNNSRSNVQTQLGGWVQGNPWLSKGTARIILNEVNSSDPSRLQGYIEVAGDRAETIIANPAGILVDGGGFINVSRATLTTGRPLIEDGDLKGFSVQRGQIVIGGAGLDASKTDYTALIARSLQVNAGLWAQRLNVITGTNQVEDATLAEVSRAAQPGNAAPLFAVDVARLGGMYANQIYLVGTEVGLGVRNAGEIGAVAGDLVVTANGRLENSGTLQVSQRLQTNARDVVNPGVMQAQGTLALTTDSLINTGSIKAGREALIKVQGDFNNEGGKVEAMRLDVAGTTLQNAHGSVVQAGQAALALEASQLINVAGTLGQLSASGGAPAPDTAGPGSTPSPPDPGDPTGGKGGDSGLPAGGGTVVSEPGPVLADGQLKFTSIDNTTGSITGNGAASLRAEGLDNRGGQIYLDNLSVVGPSIDNTNGTMTVLRSFIARTNSFVNDQGKLLVAATFENGSNSLSNRGGLLQTGELAVNVAAHLDNSGGIIRQLGKSSAYISVGDELNLERGTLETAAALNLRAGSINGIGSTLNVAGDLALESGTTSTAKSTWLIAGSMSLRTGGLDNAGGTIAGALDVGVSAAGNIENSYGLIQAGRDLNLAAKGTLGNHAGAIEALSSSSTMSLAGAAIDNRDGRIANGGNGKTTLEAMVVINSGTIGGNGELKISAPRLTNEASGSIVSYDNMELSVSDVLQNAGRINAGRDLRIGGGSTQLANRGMLIALGDIEIKAATIDNTAGQIATMSGSLGKVTLKADSLVNDGGLIDVDGQALFAIQQNVNNEHGHIRVGGDMVLNAGERIENDEGIIETAGSMRVHGGEIGNQYGRIVAAGAQASSVEADRDIDNNGLIVVNGQLTIKAETFNNGPQGTLSATGDLDLAVRSHLINDGGGIGTAGSLIFDEVHATLLNSGTITSAGNVRLNVDQINNDSGFLQAGGSLEARAGGSLRNRGGVIEALNTHGTMTVRAANIDNTGGRIVNAGDGEANISAAGQIDNSGLIGGNGRLQVGAVTMNNIGTVSSSSTIELAVSGALNNSGAINAAAGLHAGQANATLRNSGAIVAGGPLDMTLGAVDNTGGQIATAQGSNADVLLRAHNVINQTGSIMSDRNASLQVSDAFDNRSGLVQAKARLDFSAGGGLDTSGGSVETLSSDSVLQLHAGSALNDAGRIVNAGSGDTQVRVDTNLVNNGQIAGNGALSVEAHSIVNQAHGSMNGAAVSLQVGTGLENTGDISSRSTLAVAGIGASLNNHGTIVSSGDLSVHVAAIDNDGGTVATADGSGASVSLDGTSLSNHDGRIVADRALALAVSGPLDNDRGLLRAGSALAATVSGSLTNDSGVIEAVDTTASMTLGANAIRNGNGRIVNVGQASTIIFVTDTLENSGLVGANGRLDLQAGSLINRAEGTLASSGAMIAAIGSRMENAGTTNSGATLDIAAQAAQVLNSGLIVANGALTLTGGVLANDGGQVATAKDSNADLQVDAASISNRGGTIISDRDARITSVDAFENTRGTLQAAGSLQLIGSGTVGNDGGVIEALGQSANLNLRAGTLDNSTGRIVNVGTGAVTVFADGNLSSAGLIAGNGSVGLTAAELDNQVGASIVSGTTMGLTASRAIGNAGHHQQSGDPSN